MKQCVATPDFNMRSYIVYFEFKPSCHLPFTHAISVVFSKFDIWNRHTRTSNKALCTYTSLKNLSIGQNCKEMHFETGCGNWPFISPESHEFNAVSHINLHTFNSFLTKQDQLLAFYRNNLINRNATSNVCFTLPPICEKPGLNKNVN